MYVCLSAPLSISSLHLCPQQLLVLLLLVVDPLFIFTVHVDPVLMLVLYTVALVVVQCMMQCSGVLLVCVVLLAYCTIRSIRVVVLLSVYILVLILSTTSHLFSQQLLLTRSVTVSVGLTLSGYCQQYCMLMQARGQEDTQCTVLDAACYAVLCCTTLSYALYYLLFMLCIYLTT